MRTSRVLASVLCLFCVCASIDLGACGDKFARVGRSSRLKGYAPLYPASILVYAPAGVKQGDVKDFEKFLTRAGHKPVFVLHDGDVAQALASKSYDLVIVHYADVGAVVDRVRLAPGVPSVVPILPEKSKKLEPEARHAFPELITKYSMSKWDALEQLDHAMEARLKAVLPNFAH